MKVIFILALNEESLSKTTAIKKALLKYKHAFTIIFCIIVHEC